MKDKTSIIKEVNLKYFTNEHFFHHQSEFKIPDTFKDKMVPAFKAFQDLPLPGKTMEEWRRTDISRLPFNQFFPLTTEEIIHSELPVDLSGRIEITPTKTYVSLADDLQKKGVLFSSIFTMLQTHPDLLAGYFDKTTISADSAKFQTWNSAFFNRGVFLWIPKDLTVEKPFEIVISGDFDGRALLMRNIFNLEESGRAKVNIRFEKNPEQAKMLAIVSDEVFTGNNSDLELLEIQNLSKNAYFFANGASLQNRDSTVKWHNFAMGARLHKSFTGGEMIGAGANANLNGVYFAEGKQHMDMRTMQIHKSGRTNSDLLFKGAVQDKAHTIYQGMRQVAREAQSIDAFQPHKNLVVNEGARADSIPGLEICADDVKCSHGATVGHINPEEIYYLQSRGIDTTSARKMIIAGFFEEVIDRIDDEISQDLVRDLIAEKIDSN